MKRLLSSPFVYLTLCATACSDDDPNTGLESDTPTSTATSETGTSSDAPTSNGESDTVSDPDDGSDDGSDDGADDEPGCEADLQNDPSNCGSCGRDCLGGECMEGTCQPVNVHDGISDSPLATDGTWVYWYHDGTLMRASTDGSGAEMVADLGGFFSWMGVRAIEVGPSFVLVSGEDVSSNVHSMVRVDPDTGTTLLLFDSTGFTGWRGAFASDASSVYFLDYEFLAAPIAGGPVAALTPSTALGNYDRRAVGLDETHVYVAAVGFSGQGRRLFRAPRQGGNEEQFSDFAPTEMSSTPLGLLTKDATSNIDSCIVESVFTLLDAQGEKTELLTIMSRTMDLMADDEHAYFSIFCNYEGIARIPLTAGASPTILTDDISNIGRFTMDDQAIYFWSSSGLAKLAK